MTQYELTPDEVVEQLDVIPAQDLRNPVDILAGTASPLTGNEHTKYLIASQVHDMLVKRARQLDYPETFQKAIDLWEQEFENAVAFWLANFDVELTIFSLKMIETAGYKVRHINKPSIQKLNELIAQFV